MSTHITFRQLKQNIENYLKIMGIILVIVFLYLIFMVNSLQKDVQSLLMMNQIINMRTVKT
jgi:hypothetical protein